MEREKNIETIDSNTHNDLTCDFDPTFFCQDEAEDENDQICSLPSVHVIDTCDNHASEEEDTNDPAFIPAPKTIE